MVYLSYRTPDKANNYQKDVPSDVYVIIYPLFHVPVGKPIKHRVSIQLMQVIQVFDTSAVQYQREAVSHIETGDYNQNGLLLR